MGTHTGGTGEVWLCRAAYMKVGTLAPRVVWAAQFKRGNRDWETYKLTKNMSFAYFDTPEQAYAYLQERLGENFETRWLGYNE